MEQEKYFPDSEEIKEDEKLETTRKEKDQENQVMKGNETNEITEEKSDNEAGGEDIIDLKSKKFSPNNFESNKQLKKEKNEEDIRERKEKLKEEIGEFELSQQKETLMEREGIKNYADNEKAVAMSGESQDREKNLVILIEKLIPNIKPELEINTAIHESAGHDFNDFYLYDFFNEESVLSSNFRGVFLRDGNENRKKMVIERIEARINSGLSEERLENAYEWDKRIDGESRDDYYIRTVSATENDLVGFGLSQFKDQVVVDLGCGETDKGYQLACLSKAKGYIGVDMYYGEKIGKNFNTAGIEEDMEKFAEAKKIDNIKAIPASFSKSDLLKFLKRLPDNSVSIFTSGIDENVMDDNKEYIKKVNEEIQRVLSKDGVYLSYHSCFRPKELINYAFVMGKTALPLRIYKKFEKQG